MSAEFGQRRFHLGSRVFVARPPGRGNACAQHGSGVFGAAGLGQELPVLKISGNVFVMRGEERFEMLVRGGGVARIGALHGQAVAGKCVGGLGGYEVFEDLAARLLLWLGQGHAHSIFALGRNAKYLVGQPLLAVSHNLCRG